MKVSGKLFVIIALACIGGASASLGGALFVPVGVAIGALWGWGLAAMASKIIRSKNNQAWTNVVLFVTVFLAIMVAGSSLMGQLLSTAAINSQPQFFVDMIRGSIGVAEALPFYLFNTPLEWLLIPLAVLLTWSDPRQRAFMITVLLIWTLHRSWTYLYFVPQITDWSKGTAPFTSDQLVHARIWIRLSWVRHIADLATATLILLTIFVKPQVKVNSGKTRV
jgi:hypothetical protein